jgi:S-DNA-T family DNA segregation ATPase FtsK/SpoIIIE
MYVDEADMGDGSVYSEPSSRPSALDPVEPRFVTPVEFDPEPPVLNELPPKASPTLEPEDEDIQAPVLPPIQRAEKPAKARTAARSVVQPVIEPEEPAIPAAIIPTPPPVSAERQAGSFIRAEVVPGNLVSGGNEGDDLIVRPSQPDICWELPSLSLLDLHDRNVGVLDEGALKGMAAALVQKLADFGVRGEVTAIRPGPVITIFEYLPAAGVKVSKIAGLTDDIAMAMRAMRVRIVAPIPGKGVVGIEIPNKKRQTVWYRDMLNSREFRDEEWVLPMALGKSTEGRPRIADLSKMPHLLVGGTTGAGKSVGVNSMLLTMLYRCTPDSLRLILIDPKMLEFELYNDIPHLLHPVVTEPKLASAALQWSCKEMDDRYRILARWGTRNIASYNKKVEKELASWDMKKAKRYAPRVRGGGDEWKSYKPAKLPFIVIVIDELADLMMVASKEVEESIVRLAQKARACGIHLIVATQRPSVDVITGLIKANMPSRIAFQVRSKTDGRTILDQNGAETLLGKGDMLFLPPGVSALERCHGAFVADDEVARVCEFWREQGEPLYTAEIRVEEESGLGDIGDEEYDENYDLAVQIVTEAGKASTSMIQRRLRIGYNRAARIIDLMEREGVVGPADGARPRKVLVGTMEA